MFERVLRMISLSLFVVTSPICEADALSNRETHGENAVAFSPNGKWLVTGGSDGRLRIRDSGSSQVIKILEGHGVDTNLRRTKQSKQQPTRLNSAGPVLDASINALAISPDGRFIASASMDFTTRLWDVDQGKSRSILRAPVDPYPNGPRFSILAVTFNTDGRTVITGDNGGFIHLWDVESGELRNSWRADSNKVDQVACTPDGLSIISVGTEPSIRFWDFRTQKLQKILTQPGESRFHLAIAANGTKIAASRDVQITLWNTLTNKQINCFRVGIEYAPTLAFTPDGANLVVGGSTGVSFLCDIDQHSDRDRHCTNIFNPTQLEDCSAVAVSPDGRWVALCFSKLGLHVPEPNFRLIAIR